MPFIRPQIRWARLSFMCSKRPFSASMYLPQGTTISQTEDTTRAPPTTSAVFEDVSEDYKTVLAHYPPAPPTVAEILEQKQPAILPDYVEDGSSIFEDESQDYEALTDAITLQKTSSEALHSLLAENRILQASTLLHEMRFLETTLKRSPLFYDAALAVLRSDIPMPTKMQKFTQFFRHIPRAYERQYTHDFTELRRILLQDTTLNLALLERAALILAAKGFGNGALKQFLPPLFTHLPPHRIKPFLLNLTRRNMVYWHHSKGKRRETYVTENLGGLAVRYLVNANRLDEAIDLLPPVKTKRRYAYTLATYDFLLKTLRPNAKYRNVIPRIEALREIRKKLEDARGIVSKAASSMAVDGPLPPPPPADSLAHVLRYICSHFDDPDPHRTMPQVLHSFLHTYNTVTGGRTSAPRLLLSRALRTSFRATKQVVWAEMRFYRSFNRPDMVVRTFVEHFFASGVPQDRVKRTYEDVLQRRYGESVSRITGFNEHSVLPRGKLWPDLEQSAMVWEALLLLTIRDGGVPNANLVEDLYKELVAFARPDAILDIPPSHTLPSRQGTDPREEVALQHAPAVDIPAIDHPTRFGSRVLPTTFHYFMHHGMRHFGPHWCQRIVEDMRSLGLWPGILHWSSLARSWAEFGRDRRRERFPQEENAFAKQSVERVWAIVDAVENGSIVEWAMTGDQEAEDSTPEKKGASRRMHSDSRKHLHMQPDIPFYVNVMHGFLYAKDAENAEAVAARLAHRFGPRKAVSHPSVSRAMKKLEDLKALLRKENLRR